MGWQYFEYPVNPSAYFYPRALHDAIGPYDEAEKYAMDTEFVLRAVRAVRTLYFNETWGNFRFFEGTKTMIHARSGLAEGVRQRIYRAHLRALPWRTRLLVATRIAYYKMAYRPVRAWRRRASARAAH